MKKNSVASSVDIIFTNAKERSAAINKIIRSIEFNGYISISHAIVHLNGFEAKTAPSLLLTLIEPSEDADDWGWGLSQIEGISSIDHPYFTEQEERADEYTAYLIRFSYPKPITDIREKPNDTGKDLEGINDGGERISYGENMAVREPSDGKGRFDLISPFALERIAKWYELGAKKYSDRNWEKGIPFSRYLDSSMRHLNNFLKGMTDEDHLAAAAWNIMAIMHHQELEENALNDLPNYMDDRRIQF